MFGGGWSSGCKAIRAPQWIQGPASPATKYPATLVTTGEHDNRVLRAHRFKFAAALQPAQAGAAPVLIRIETRTGHG